MTVAAGVKLTNCGKDHRVFLYLEDGREVKRGDSMSPDNKDIFVCSDVPRFEGQDISKDWKLPFVDIDINVEKTREEVTDPREGITVRCTEIRCPFNAEYKGVER